MHRVILVSSMNTNRAYGTMKAEIPGYFLPQRFSPGRFTRYFRNLERRKKMKQRRLGKNGPMVSAIGLECMGMSGVYGLRDEAESITTVHRALVPSRPVAISASLLGLMLPTNLFRCQTTLSSMSRCAATERAGGANEV